MIISPVLNDGNMKLSTNAILFETFNSNCYMLVHTYNKSACLITKETFDIIQKGHIEKLKLSNPDLWKTLNNMDVLTKNNDTKTIEAFNQLRKNQSIIKSHGITFILTLDCNLNCPYCMQADGFKHNDFDAFSNENAINQIMRFIDEYIVHTNSEIPINLNWYGGEPLLKYGYIEKLYTHFKEKYSDRRITSTVTSNGTILTDTILQTLIKVNTKTIQITVDGNEVIHNQVRSLKSGKPTYKTILNNIETLMKYMKVIIRYNWHISHGLSPIHEFYKTMTERFNSESNIDYYTIPIVSNTKTCGSFENINDIYVKQMLKKYIQADYQARIDNQLEPRGIGFDVFNCNANKDGNIAIAPNGDLYLCIGSVGNKDAIIGNIIDGYNGKEKTFRDELPIDDECKSCAFLLSCGGGCRYNAHEERGNIHAKHCSKEKNEITLKQNYLLIFKKEISEF